MSRPLKTLGVLTATLAVGLAAGFSLGQRQGLALGLGFLESEVVFSLGMHVEAASCVRIGDTDCALKALDLMIDLAAANSQSRPELTRLQSSMGQVKVYRRVAPSQGPYASAVEGALARIPDEKPTTSGLRRLAAGIGR